MTVRYDVRVSGAGVVGRTTALLLAREHLKIGLTDWSATAGSQAADVRAYALNHASREVLESLRVWPAGTAVTAVQHMHVVEPSGRQIRWSADQVGVEALAWIVDSGPLMQGLTDALRFQRRIEAVQEPHTADLRILCEGRDSSSREALAVPLRAHDYRQTAIAARLRCAHPHGHTARQWFTADGVLALLPLGGDGGAEVALVWSVSNERLPALASLSDAAFAAQVSAVAQGALGDMTLASTRQTWPLRAHFAQHWCGKDPQGDGSWVLAGDAAHAIHPMAGQGLNLGLADATTLATTLAKKPSWRKVNDLKLLRSYERARKAACEPLTGALDGLHQLFFANASAFAQLRAAGVQGFNALPFVKNWAMRQAAGLGRGV